jgi:hypothetical protein
MLLSSASILTEGIYLAAATEGETEVTEYPDLREM